MGVVSAAPAARQPPPIQTAGKGKDEKAKEKEKDKDKDDDEEGEEEEEEEEDLGLDWMIGEEEKEEILRVMAENVGVCERGCRWLLSMPCPCVSGCLIARGTTWPFRGGRSCCSDAEHRRHPQPVCSPSTAPQDFTMDNVNKWNLRKMEAVWRQELKRRKDKLPKEPSKRCAAAALLCWAGGGFHSCGLMQDL